MRLLVSIGTIFLAVFAFMAVPASAQTCSVPGYSSIQAAIDDPACATVSIAAGTYYENLYVWRGVTLNGAGAASTVIDGSSVNSVVFVPNFTGAVTLTDLTIQHGSAYKGGGISSWEGNVLTLQRVAVRNNVGYFWGGGILSYGYAATVSISDSTIADNVMPYNDGAGMRVYGGTATVTNSTFSNNSTGGGFGGGIAHSGSLTITNSTFVGNSGGYGGGIGSDGYVQLNFVTFSGNSANGPYGGGGILNFSYTDVKNVVFADSPVGGNYNFYGGDTASGANFSTDGSASGITVVTDAQLALGALANNGGRTQTMLPATGSVLIDAAADCTTVSLTAVTTDQRGIARPQGAACDAGAVEVAPPTPAQIVADLATQVASLGLDAGTASGVTDKLTAASQSLARGNTNAAKGQLGSFVNQVNALVKSKRITAAQGQALANSANAVIAGL